MKLSLDERGVEGLPIRLIVVLVIGVVALAAIVGALNEFRPNKTLGAAVIEVDGVDGNLLTITATGAEEVSKTNVKVVVRVSDVDGEPVIGASVSLTGLGAAASAMTGADGNATVRFSSPVKITLQENQNEGYLALEVVSDGFNDYSNERALKVARIH